jgi:hypothetical protein
MPQVVYTPAPTPTETAVKVMRDLLLRLDEDAVPDQEKVAFVKSKISFLIGFLDRER